MKMNNEAVQRFERSVTVNAQDYGVELTNDNIRDLGKYYALLARWNERLHLVAPCEPEEFAGRHVLESLLLLKFFSEQSRVIDVGSGGGLPIIPCLIVRPDLSATLIESSQKKSIFLREVLKQTGTDKRGTIISQRFTDVEPPPGKFVTSRALDDFMNQIATLLQWAPEGSTLLLFGGESMRDKLDQLTASYREMLIPGSEKRFLFDVKK